MDTEIQYWLSDKEVGDIYSGIYCNDEDEEEDKELYIMDGNTEKLLRYLKEKTTYCAEYESILGFSNKIGMPIKGVGLDLAAGVLWTTALLSQIDSVEKIFALEISQNIGY